MKCWNYLNVFIFGEIVGGVYASGGLGFFCVCAEWGMLYERKRLIKILLEDIGEKGDGFAVFNG